MKNLGKMLAALLVATTSLTLAAPMAAAETVDCPGTDTPNPAFQRVREDGITGEVISVIGAGLLHPDIDPIGPNLKDSDLFTDLLPGTWSLAVASVENPLALSVQVLKTVSGGCEVVRAGPTDITFPVESTSHYYILIEYGPDAETVPLPYAFSMVHHPAP